MGQAQWELSAVAPRTTPEKCMVICCATENATLAEDQVECLYISVWEVQVPLYESVLRPLVSPSHQVVADCASESWDWYWSCIKS